MNYYFRAFKNYAKCKGRATRREYWMFMLFHCIAIFTVAFLGTFFGMNSAEMPTTFGYIALAYFIFSICPFICIQIRRLHDVGKGGYWWFLGRAIPVIQLYVFYLTCKKGNDYTNKYGPPTTGQTRLFYADERTEDDFL